jgi:hypothetical protein
MLVADFGMLVAFCAAFAAMQTQFAFGARRSR